ncbi:epoxyqueuosine reductase QueH [Candidatus Saccharibacteria bacterium]|nr:epoxyqueuosine reductase QueH [Candidatus Saccharibacteria bacterium]
MKLLLHTCCAPCSVYCIKTLRAEKIEPTLFWYNPNIHPYAEYKARRDCLKEYAKAQKVKLILEDAYGLDDFVCNVSGDLINRCANYCYPKRLEKVFEYARDNGYDTVSTTLLYSIYQQHDIIKNLMEDLSKKYGIKFLYRDFREGWKEGQNEAREAGLYMQKYCGCVFSEEESMVGRELARKLKKRGIAPTNQNVRKIIEENKAGGELRFENFQ